MLLSSDYLPDGCNRAARGPILSLRRLSIGPSDVTSTSILSGRNLDLKGIHRSFSIWIDPWPGGAAECGPTTRWWVQVALPLVLLLLSTLLPAASRTVLSTLTVILSPGWKISVAAGGSSNTVLWVGSPLSKIAVPPSAAQDTWFCGVA